MGVGPFASEIDELAKIDYLLDQVARSVERGALPRSAYDALAPRYLARRAELVAIVTGAPVAAPVRAESPHIEFPVATARRERPAREHRPVRWTTVLLFLGAFLVVVSSAIFSVAVWDILGTFAKFGFMSALTAVFYAAGWYAKSKLELRAGSTALVAVASAMLLFDGWILIDGYDLAGMLPWALLLLVCSVAYWATEVWLADRFFGVVGAAAQMAWWWLLGAGLGLPVAARLAGMALVVLAWQIASERAVDDPTLGSLALVLRWAAPAAALALAVGSVVDTVSIGAPTAAQVAYAAVVAACASAVARRSDVVPAPGRGVAGALVEAPFFLAAWVSLAENTASWWVVAIIAAAALTNDVAGYALDEAAYIVCGLLSELLLVIAICVVGELSAETTVLLVAALAALWSLGSRLLGRAAREEPRRAVIPVAARLCEWGAFILLVAASLAVPLVTQALPLTVRALTASEALLALGVLAAWWASATVRRNPVVSFAGSVWAFYALASLESWLVPDRHPAAYAAGLVALAGVWLASGYALEARQGHRFAETTRWSARAATWVIGTLGIALTLA
ncbi:MAG: hypothetical protein FDZ75_02060, partial [Actinobacteria bacterium]